MRTSVNIEVTPEELEALIRRAVREESKIIQTSEPEEIFITRHQAKAILGVRSDTSMIEYEKRGLIVPYRTGKKILYKESEIREAVKKFQRV